MIRFANLVSRDCYHRINEINNETFPVFLAGFQSRVDLSAFVAIYGCLFDQLLRSSRNDFTASNTCLRLLGLPFFFLNLTFHIILCFKHKSSPGYFQIKKPNRVNNLQWRKSESYLEKTHLVRKGEGFLLTNEHKKVHSFIWMSPFRRA